MRKININADTTFKYLQVFNGILELTDKELDILSRLVDAGSSDNICSVDSKKKVASDLGVEDYNTLNNYVKRLKDKGAIVKHKKGYILSPLLKPSNKTVIQINYDETHA